MSAKNVRSKFSSFNLTRRSFGRKKEEKKRADVTYRTLRASEARQSGAPASQTLKGDAYLLIYCFRNLKERRRFCLIKQRSSPP